MKYIILLLIGIISVTTVVPNKNSEVSNENPLPVVETASAVSPKADTPKSDHKKVASKEGSKPVDVVKENPNNCDHATEWIWSDGSCHAKDSRINKEQRSSAPRINSVASGSCEEAIAKYFPPHEIANANKVMFQESSGNPANHNYNPSTGDDSYGCFQINLYGNNKYSRPSPAELVIADNNVRFAYNLWKSTGWCSTGGWINTGIKVGIC